MSTLAESTFASEATNGGLSAEIVFGATEEMQRIRRLVNRVASVRVPMLIEGESGTGKETIASYLHRISPWKERPFVKVNCAAIPGTLLESELFGYEKGSFTGAYTTRPGKFELAEGGTIVLDEIADIDSGLQAKLLQVLQDGTFYRIGDLVGRRTDVRVIAITSRNVEAEREKGTFRQDLYYRINVVSLRVPPLRERLEDLPGLVNYFVGHYAKQFRRPALPFPARLLDRFQQHHWPGNIRELENYVKRYVILGNPDNIIPEMEACPRRAAAGEFQMRPPKDLSLKKFAKQASQEAERYLILEALRQTRWNRKRTAQLLGISYRALLYKIRESGFAVKKRLHTETETASSSLEIPVSISPLAGEKFDKPSNAIS
jgi:two-component system response regulator AtoC